MNQIRRFERIMGGRWTGITFHREMPTGLKTVAKPMFFCEAVQASSRGPLTLTKESLSCPGGRKSFGWSSNDKDRFVDKLKEKNGWRPKISNALIHKVPRLDAREITAVTIGTYGSPDVLISYLQPEVAMRFVSQWQGATGETLSIGISSIMAVCGGVAAGSYKTGEICCSFGCIESRRHGAIGRDRLIMGFPASLAIELF